MSSLAKNSGSEHNSVVEMDNDVVADGLAGNNSDCDDMDSDVDDGINVILEADGNLTNWNTDITKERIGELDRFCLKILSHVFSRYLIVSAFVFRVNCGVWS